MNQEKPLLDDLKKNGYRLTNARVQILNIFLKSATPLAADEVLEKLTERNIRVNKTTVYREVDFLTEIGLLKEIHFDDRKKRYEMADLDHHHHLVCIRCKKVEDFAMPEDSIHLKSIEDNKIHKQKGFKVLSHSLEFFGLCRNCH